MLGRHPTDGARPPQPAGRYQANRSAGLLAIAFTSGFTQSSRRAVVGRRPHPFARGNEGSSSAIPTTKIERQFPCPRLAVAQYEGKFMMASLLLAHSDLSVEPAVTDAGEIGRTTASPRRGDGVDLPAPGTEPPVRGGPIATRAVGGRHEHGVDPCAGQDLPPVSRTGPPKPLDDGDPGPVRARPHANVRRSAPSQAVPVGSTRRSQCSRTRSIASPTVGPVGGAPPSGAGSTPPFEPMEGDHGFVGRASGPPSRLFRNR